MVMGVQGAGKSTIGTLLAERLGVGFVDGDRLHSEENIATMAAHIATGATSYIVALALLYAPTLFKMFRARPQRSSP